MSSNGLVYKYTKERIQELLSPPLATPLNSHITKHRIKYFKDYLNELKAKTIIVEDDYIDRDFLEDFSAYYVRCFKDYVRKCKRLHFFKISFKKQDFINFLKGENSPITQSVLDKAYLGFIVIKPLPLTLIGRTCLGTYPRKKNREFPTTRKYTTNLYGITLNVESLAFQEQDKVVAACATSSMWSVFHVP